MPCWTGSNCMDAHGCSACRSCMTPSWNVSGSSRARSARSGTADVEATCAPTQLQVEFEAAFGAPLRNMWGATEVVGALREGLQPGPVTRIAPGAQIRLVDNEGRNVPRGEVGEFLVRGPYVTVGYWVGPDRIDDATRDGWYHSGDLMRQGEGDELWFVGRKKDSTRPVKATCRIAGVREIVGPLTWELMGKRDDGDNPFRFRAAPALDDG